MSIAIRPDAIAAALGITPDSRVRIEITRDGWDNATCEETGAPGAVLVEWSTRDPEGGYQATDWTVSGVIAGGFINGLLTSDLVNPYTSIDVKIAHQYIRFMHPTLADAARYMDGPTGIAA